MDAERIKKCEEVTPSTGLVYAGLGPDYRVLVKAARKAAQKYSQTYHEVEPVPMLVKDMASICQEATQQDGASLVCIIVVREHIGTTSAATDATTSCARGFARH